MDGRGNDVIDLLPPYSSKTSRATAPKQKIPHHWYIHDKNTDKCVIACFCYTHCVVISLYIVNVKKVIIPKFENIIQNCARCFLPAWCYASAIYARYLCLFACPPQVGSSTEMAEWITFFGIEATLDL